MLLCNVFSVFSQSVDVRACAGDHAVYAASGMRGSTYEYTLDNSDAGELTVFDKDSILVKWGTVPGVYRLGVRETNRVGCVGDWAYLNVEIITGAKALFTRAEYQLCTNGTATVDFNKSAFRSWQWMDASIGADDVIRQPGTYELQTIDHNNCVMSSFAVVVPCPEDKPIYLVTVSVNNNLLGSATGGGYFEEGDD